MFLHLSDFFFYFFEQVLIFAEKKADVDAIHEYLLLKGVEAVAIHGGKGTRLQTALSRSAPLSLLSGEFCQVTSRCHLCSVLPQSGCLPDQEERTKAIEAFKEGKKDVLVATDVASKGLDFPAIQHVVNYDMPEEIENYGTADRAGCVVKAAARLLTFLFISSSSPQDRKNWTIRKDGYCHHVHQ